MKIIYGDTPDTSELHGHKIIEFRIHETVYRNGKVEIKSWAATVEDRETRG